jgi:DHA2 family multidrug resistance protein
VATKPTDRSFPAAPVALDVVEYGARRLLIVAGVMLAALLQTLDATIVNVALPTIEGNIGASIDDGTWIITAYIIANVVAIPLAPFFLQRFGRRNYFAASIIGFTAASFFCGTASSLGELIFFRVVQGAFGGGLIATSQIILRDTFPPDKLGPSSALFAIALTVGPALGPTLGGFLTDAYSWQWVFDINLIPGTLAAIIILTTLRNPTPPRRMPFDAPGVALLVVALGSMQFVLDEGERNDWFDDGRIVFAACAAVIGLAAFIVWELRGTKNPIVDLRIFRYRNIRFGTLSAIVLGMVVFGPVVILPQYVQGVLGFTATLSGLLILMRALPVLVLTPFVARFASILDFRAILVIGFLLSAGSFVALALHMTTESDFSTFPLLLVVSGIGQSMLLVPLLVGMLSTVAPADAPKASSFISLSVQMGGSIASTMLVTIYDRRTYFHSDVLRGAVNLAHRSLFAESHIPSLRVFARILAQQSANQGFADSILSLAPLAFCGVILAVFLKRNKSARPAVHVAAE